MQPLVRASGATLVVALAACLSLVQACGSKATPPAVPDAASAEVGMIPATPAATCLALRKCIYTCGEDKVCAMRCVSGASQPARTPYQLVEMCTMRQCPTGDEGCRCDNECFSDGMCFDLAVECANGEADPMCEELCH